MIALSAIMKRVSQSSRKASSKVGQIRIIAGQWRGRKLPVADVQGLRPTTDRNKETLFNWLMHDLHDARCLDVFAGSGSLGLEALSRYAAFCQFFEQDRRAATTLTNNLQTLNAEGSVLQGDALAYLQQKPASPFNIVFVDPPFGQQLINPALQALCDKEWVTAGSLVYVEHEPDAPAVSFPVPVNCRKTKRLNQLHYHLFEIS
ncbi:16S rRNA (guanine(966)-N(2))-methyltransferase RsmD [Alteromonas sp. ASW11-19]|uniref:Ribosomal RNA small subunit methyltransferase D n=1 Tax=Alteromonas salexigens TaxID=2982530 RepID=A0ABT2VMR1_9ALTE|nr:16S rRNA (guanine(966)-N(2))-methyltransferase RsmD [Alteromonas salexigens]MCU7554539.1 16S rRNA (guanine(966)-N(2))-methyltransferase RsmD [Alteromonas salexigens]